MLADTWTADLSRGQPLSVSICPPFPKRYLVQGAYELDENRIDV
jgi:hypothetical protein